MFAFHIEQLFLLKRGIWSFLKTFLESLCMFVLFWTPIVKETHQGYEYTSSAYILRPPEGVYVWVYGAHVDVDMDECMSISLAEQDTGGQNRGLKVKAWLNN